MRRESFLKEKLHLFSSKKQLESFNLLFVWNIWGIFLSHEFLIIFVEPNFFVFFLDMLEFHSDVLRVNSSEMFLDIIECARTFFDLIAHSIVKGEVVDLINFAELPMCKIERS